MRTHSLPAARIHSSSLENSLYRKIATCISKRTNRKRKRKQLFVNTGMRRFDRWLPSATLIISVVIICVPCTVKRKRAILITQRALKRLRIKFSKLRCVQSSSQRMLRSKYNDTLDESIDERILLSHFFSEHF